MSELLVTKAIYNIINKTAENSLVKNIINGIILEDFQYDETDNKFYGNTKNQFDEDIFDKLCDIVVNNEEVYLPMCISKLDDTEYNEIIQESIIDDYMHTEMTMKDVLLIGYATVINDKVFHTLGKLQDEGLIDY